MYFWVYYSDGSMLPRKDLGQFLCGLEEISRRVLDSWEKTSEDKG